VTWLSLLLHGGSDWLLLLHTLDSGGSSDLANAHPFDAGAQAAGEDTSGQGAQRVPELGGGNGVDERVHQAVCQLGGHDVVAQLDVHPGVLVTHTAKDLVLQRLWTGGSTKSNPK
jgi:hypothetical protein